VPNKLSRFLIWLTGTGGGAALVSTALSNMDSTKPLSIAPVALLGIGLVAGLAMLAVGLTGFSLEVVQWVNRVLPDPPSVGHLQEPQGERIPTVAPGPAGVTGAAEPTGVTGAAGRTGPGTRASGAIAPTMDRTILDVTPEFLVGLFADKLAIQGNKLVAPFLNNWIYVSGPLGDVMGARPLQVTFAFDPARRFHIYMYFDASWADRLAVLQPGQHITVLGRIRDASIVGVDLADCELVQTTAVQVHEQSPTATPSAGG
jgi:hypothetical protein